jgi:putative ABC transport system permease protein
MLGVIIGVASVILLVSIGSGLKEIITQQFEELGTDLLTVFPGELKFGDAAGREGGPPGSSNNKLTIDIADLISKRSTYITDVTPVATTFAETKFLGEKRTTGILGTTANYETIRKSPTSKGRFFTKQEFSSAKRVAIIGQTTAKELYKNRTAVNEKIKIAGKTFKVIGVFKSKGAALGNDQDDLVAIPITAFERVFNLDKVSYIYTKVIDVDKIPQAKRELENILLTQLDDEEFSVIDPKEFLSTVNQILAVLTTGLAGIAAISLIVGGIGIANIMLVSVTERIKEIGLRKAVGATSKDILFQFLTEAAVLSVFGGIIGIFIGSTGAFILNKFVNTSVTYWSVLIGFLVSVATGIISGVGPAYKAAKMNPIEALRYE